MPRLLSDAALRATRDPVSAEVWLWFVEVTHPELAEPLRYVSGTDQETATGAGDGILGSNVDVLGSNVDILGSSVGGNWVPAPFTVTPPAEGLPRLPTATLRVPAVDGSIIKALVGTVEPPWVSLHAALASSPTLIEIGPYDMRMARVSDGIAETVIELSYEDLLGRAVVGERYTPMLTPALHK